MPTFQKCPTAITEMANSVLVEFATHKPLLDARVKVDLVFAYSDKDEGNHPKNNALSKNGRKALGIARIISLKDRALGRGDCEVSLDGDWWDDATEEQQRALLDHELHHFAVKIDKRGLVRDDLGRAVLKMRKHDYEFGWFRIIAERHGRPARNESPHR